MTLEIKVNPEAIKSLTKDARVVPNERIDSAIEKLEQLESNLASWKGEGKQAFDEVQADLKDTLSNTKALMNAMLAALDKATDDFSEMDEEISTRFEQAVDNYTAD